MEAPLRHYNQLLRNPNDGRSIYEMLDILRGFVGLTPMLVD